MHYQLKYAGVPGEIVGELIHDGQVIATQRDLSDGGAANKWARRYARDHKIANTPETTQAEHVTVTGESTFSI